MVDRETAAWNALDAESLVDLFHPDMVWAWPPDSASHDPSTWVLALGRYDRTRWKSVWQELFETHELVHNNRKTVRFGAGRWRLCGRRRGHAVAQSQERRSLSVEGAGVQGLHETALWLEAHLSHRAPGLLES
ncbi:MAG TPA: hypothetical protein VEG84_08635 [Thermoanaerobaculia bacterium]|nr:hypothetical protein [Thermoanaerobaculia bacterium]